MRDLRELDIYRVKLDYIKGTDPKYEGAFIVPFNPGLPLHSSLKVLASSGGGWSHVSVSLADRCPTWNEMDMIARMFFRDDEVAMQLHLPRSDHINNHPFVLHIWAPNSKLNKKKIPLPPKAYV